MRNIGIALSLLLCAVALDAIDIFRHPEIADHNALFADVGIAPLVFPDLDFPIIPLEIRLEYVPPLPLPFSVGMYFKTPHPNLKSFGARLSYHIDLNDSKTDLYATYVFDCGFVRNDKLEEYNDTPVEIHYYDFRAGIRRFFGRWIGLAVESDFQFRGLILLISTKIH